MHKIPTPSFVRGFTLIEAVMVIAITGIIAAIAAVFIKRPVESYFDMARRAELTDVADTAIRRMTRDMRSALPNSVRNPDSEPSGNDQCIEFIPTKIGGRYRAAADGTGAGDILDFTTSDSSFDMLWPNSLLPAASQIAAGDIVVLYNDGSTNGSAYLGNNAIKVLSVLEPGGALNSTKINFDTTAGAPFNVKQLPSESPANRFQVISAATHVLSYGCSGTVLTRYSRTLTSAWSLPHTCAAMASGATAAVLANNVTSCSLKYDPPGSSTGLSRFGIVSISLGITQSGESVKLYNQIHVDNTP
jgi:MSHA biogenesis protein MshO